MKPHFFLILLIAFGFFSCSSEEETPITQLNGTYLGNVLGSDDNPHYVEMTFQANGELKIEEYRLNGENERCYSSISEGNYTLKGNEFSYTINSFLGLDPAAFSECFSQAELMTYLENSGLIQVGTVEFKSEWDVFSISYPCYDLIPNARTNMCVAYSDFVLQD